MRMAGVRRNILEGKIVIPPDVKKAGVLVLFYPDKGNTMLVFIRRAEYPGVHSGQISFPGGGREPQDASMTETALREAEEEIGINRRDVEVIGQLSDLFIPPSNFLVTPVVGYLDYRPAFHPDPGEVSGIIEISVADLLSERTVMEKEITVFPAMKLRVPCFYVNEQVIWGATAMMLSELLALLSPVS